MPELFCILEFLYRPSCLLIVPFLIPCRPLPFFQKCMTTSDFSFNFIINFTLLQHFIFLNFQLPLLSQLIFKLSITSGRSIQRACRYRCPPRQCCCNGFLKVGLYVQLLQPISSNTDFKANILNDFEKQQFYYFRFGRKRLQKTRNYVRIIIIKMIRNATKILTSACRPSAFSTTYKTNQPFRSKTQDQSMGKPYVTKDAERVFQQFFKENPPKESEQYLFQYENKNNKQTTNYDFCLDPYHILGVKTGASNQQIDKAYRELAIKYYPKVDSSSESAQKFIQVSRAYQMLRPKKSEGKKKPSTGFSYMNQFNGYMKQFFGLQSGIGSSKKSKSGSNVINAEIYSQTKKIKKIGDKKRVVIEREFNDNGKLVKLTQVEDHQDEGDVEVTEIFEDENGKKTNKFTKA